MNDITTAEFRQLLEAHGVVMSKQRFHQGPLKAMIESGVARQSGRTWLIDGSSVDEWVKYIVEFAKQYEGLPVGGAGKKRDLLEFVTKFNERTHRTD
jgi:hypothetical protein